MLALAALAMDPANPLLLYAGTGEGLGNLDVIHGAGVFKTSDGGVNWTRLASTRSWRRSEDRRCLPMAMSSCEVATGNCNLE